MRGGGILLDGSAGGGGKAERPDVATVYSRHRADVLRFCLAKLDNSADAHDVVQEAFFRLLRRSGKQEIRRPRQFLLETAMNLIRDKWRAERSKDVRAHVSLEIVPEDELVSPLPSAESRVESNQDVAAALKALSELPRKCQAVFVMKCFWGKSYREIADELGIASVVGVKKYMMRALAHLRAHADMQALRMNGHAGGSMNGNANGHGGGPTRPAQE